MNEAVPTEATPSQVAEYEATIDRYIAEMEEMQIQISDNRRETARLKAETEQMLQETLTLLKVA